MAPIKQPSRFNGVAWVFGLVAAITTSPPQAGDTRKCEAAATEEAMVKCLSSLDAADRAELQRIGQHLKKRAESTEFSRSYDSAAKAWLAFRDADCTVQTFESRHGTGFRTIYTACLVEANEARLHVLRERAANP